MQTISGNEIGSWSQQWLAYFPSSMPVLFQSICLKGVLAEGKALGHGTFNNQMLINVNAKKYNYILIS